MYLWCGRKLLLANEKGKKNVELLKLICLLIFTIAPPYLAYKLFHFYKCQTQVVGPRPVLPTSHLNSLRFSSCFTEKNSLQKCWKRSFINKTQWHFAVCDNYRRTHYTEPFRQLFVLSCSGLGASNSSVDSGKSVLRSSCSKAFCSISDSVCIALLDYSSPVPGHLLFNRPWWAFIYFVPAMVSWELPSVIC